MPKNSASLTPEQLLELRTWIAAGADWPEAIPVTAELWSMRPNAWRYRDDVIRRETNSNFGFNLPWWDVLLGTYRSQPAEGHEQMTIGLPH